MSERYCFWSVADGRYTRMMQRLVDSARAVGVFKDFHVWSDRTIQGAVGHSVPTAAKTGMLFTLELLEQEVSKLKYDYFVWLDADTLFVRSPGNVLRVLGGAPVHASLETNVASAQTSAIGWEGCSLSNVTTLMRFCGIRNRAVFSVNSGFWVVHHDVIDTFCGLARGFGDLCGRAGYTFSLEPLLAYAVQMLCGDPYRHRLRQSADLWATDHADCHDGGLPRGRAWPYEDPITRERFDLNPAIVHVPQSKRALAVQTRARPSSSSAKPPQDHCRPRVT